jgi:integrase
MTRMTSNHKRYKHNEVKLTVDKKSDALQLWLPKKYSEQYFGKRQKAISFGAKDTLKNRREAEQARLQLQIDLQEGVFDPEEIIKYQHSSKQASRGYVPKSQQKKWGLYELWRKFAETKKSVVAETTYAKKYSEGCVHDRYFRELRKQSFSRTQDQSEIRNELADKVEGKTILVECLKFISSMINWAIDEELLAKDHPNRFGQFGKEQEQFNKRNNLGRQKIPKAFQGIGENNPEKIAFTSDEDQHIISAFHNRRNRYPGVDYLAYMVEFLFLTGMRHGEARGLNWGDVSQDRKRLTIARSYSPVGTNAKHIMKSTKNGKVRELPLNQRAQEILREIRPNCPNANDPIFVDVKGRRLKCLSMYSVWTGQGKIKSPIMPLVEEGKVSQYLKPYATRKTFITRQLQNGFDYKTVAYWVGDEVVTTMEYYSDINWQAVPV